MGDVRNYRVVLDANEQLHTSTEFSDGRTELTVTFEIHGRPRLWHRIRQATRTWWDMVTGYRWIVFAEYVPLRQRKHWLRVNWT